MPAIHQLVAGFSKGDAITNEARALQGLFRTWGRPGDIFCEQKRILTELRGDCRDLREAATAVHADDLILLHLSIGSVANDEFARLPGRKALLYHNITPPHFFKGLNEEIVRHLERGREQVRALSGAAEVNMAVSRFNASELEAAGYRDVKVKPLAVDTSLWDAAPGRRVLRAFDDGAPTVLFVGRGAPNKRIEDLVYAFYFIQRMEPDARLVHVGSYAGLERYQALLRTKIVELKLRNIHFVGSVPQADLNAYFRCAKLFLCASEHEGFCIPLLEAMHHRVPVLAFAAGAVPETLDGAGVLFREKQWDAVAEMAQRLMRDESLRAAVLRKQDARLARYRTSDPDALLRQHLSPLL